MLVGLTYVTDAEKEHLVPFLGSYETLDVQKKNIMKTRGYLQIFSFQN